ncbi:hypothetical protein MPL3356_140262 [Mesorhizobium plurifarium]|uniref:Uncharacterized protein n=1 Tax=Mesorhizobium plurifarium TaxID=69974 RepID=A0A090DJE6_MESPL|nr:hypothetical protein MPL3356_140262 [Mesorhizobium plurifarium]
MWPSGLACCPLAKQLVASSIKVQSADGLQSSDQVAIAAIGRRMIGMRGFVEPGGAFVLVAARPAPVNGTTGDGCVIRHNFQLPVDTHLPHHAFHQGGFGVSPDQIFEKAHVGTLLRPQIIAISGGVRR